MRTILYLSLAAIMAFARLTSVAQDARVTYQGRLNSNGTPAAGVYDLSFTVFSTAVGGEPVGTSQTNGAVTVSNGLFSVFLNFDENTFNGSERWLEIAVRTIGGANFATLAPRQRVTSAPYAITARNVTGAIPASQLGGALASENLSGIYSSVLTFSNPNNSFAGSGVGLLGVNATTLQGFGAASFWQLNGNSGTSSGTHFVGTTDNQSFEVKVNGRRVLRLEPTTGSPNLVGGFAENQVSAGVVGATIGGGGDSGMRNSIQTGLGIPNYSTIAGGLNHVINAASHATISGGWSNSILKSFFGGNESTIGGGSFNLISQSDNAVIGGGRRNTIELSYSSTIHGGESNYVAVASGATIGGGKRNRNSAHQATIAGGVDNLIIGSDFGNSAVSATIGGGTGNSISFVANNATIAGGIGNSIGQQNGKAASVGGGESNRIGHLAGYSTIAGGAQNTIDMNSQGGTIAGGTSNLIGRPFATIPGGFQAKATSFGQMAYASGNFVNIGDAQASVYVCRGTTATTTLTELFLDGSGERVRVPANSTWAFEVLVSGRSSTGESAGFQIRGTIKNNGGTTSIVGAPVSTSLGSDVVSWAASIAADNDNDALIIRVNGSAATSVRWVASVRTSEVGF